MLAAAVGVEAFTLLVYETEAAGLATLETLEASLLEIVAVYLRPKAAGRGRDNNRRGGAQQQGAVLDSAAPNARRRQTKPEGRPLRMRQPMQILPARPGSHCCHRSGPMPPQRH